MYAVVNAFRTLQHTDTCTQAISWDQNVGHVSNNEVRLGNAPIGTQSHNVSELSVTVHNIMKKTLYRLGKGLVFILCTANPFSFYVRMI